MFLNDLDLVALDLGEAFTTDKTRTLFLSIICELSEGTQACIFSFDHWGIQMGKGYACFYADGNGSAPVHLAEAHLVLCAECCNME